MKDSIQDNWRECIDYIKDKANSRTKLSPNRVAKKFKCGATLPKVALRLMAEKVGAGLYEWIGPEFLTDEDYQRVVNAYREEMKVYNTGSSSRKKRTQMNGKFDLVDVVVELAAKGVDKEMIRHIANRIKSA